MALARRLVQPRECPVLGRYDTEPISEPKVREVWLRAAWGVGRVSYGGDWYCEIEEQRRLAATPAR